MFGITKSTIYLSFERKTVKYKTALSSEVHNSYVSAENPYQYAYKKILKTASRCKLQSTRLLLES